MKIGLKIPLLIMFAISCSGSNCKRSAAVSTNTTVVNNTSNAQASVMFINALSDASDNSISVSVANNSVVNALGFTSSSGYVNVPAGQQTITAFQVSNSAQSIVTGSVNLQVNKKYTVIFSGPASARVLDVYDDTTTSPGSGNAKVRVINSTPNLGFMTDVYVRNFPITSAPTTPLLTIDYRGAMNFVETNGITGYTVTLTQKGTTTAVGTPLALSSLTAGQSVTVVLMPAATPTYQIFTN